MIMNIWRCVLFFAVAAATTAMRSVVLNETNFVSLIGPVTSNSVDAVLLDWSHPSRARQMNRTKHAILYIDSPGGSVHAGSRLVQYIRAIQNQNVTVDCIAQNFMSMAFIIMQACDGRFVLENSVGMQHQMSMSMRGDIENLRSMFRLHDRMNERMIRMEIDKIGIDREDYMERIINDWWLYGEDNVDENTADEVILYSCAPSLYGAVVEREERILGMTFTVRIHRCPLFREVMVSEKAAIPFYESDFYAERAREWTKLIF
jgi:ATP-dependent protease ClpP protease subunit